MAFATEIPMAHDRLHVQRRTVIPSIINAPQSTSGTMPRQIVDHPRLVHRAVQDMQPNQPGTKVPVGTWMI
jgi:hypothetical protein